MGEGGRKRGRHSELCSHVLRYSHVYPDHVEDGTVARFKTSSEPSAACAFDAKAARTSDELLFKMVKDPSLQVTIQMNLTEAEVTIDLLGPADVWFGVAFGAHSMADRPYAIIIPAGGGQVHERKLGTCGDEAGHCEGDVLSPSIEVLSNKEMPNADPMVNHGKPLRKIRLKRPRPPLTPLHFDFTNTFEIPMLSAVGSGPSLAYHASHNKQTLFLFDRRAANCVCLGPNYGQLCSHWGSGCAGGPKDPAGKCAGTLPLDVTATCGDLGWQQNPTLLPRTYVEFFSAEPNITPEDRTSSRGLMTLHTPEDRTSRGLMTLHIILHHNIYLQLHRGPFTMSSYMYHNMASMYCRRCLVFYSTKEQFFYSTGPC